MAGWRWSVHMHEDSKSKALHCCLCCLLCCVNDLFHDLPVLFALLCECLVTWFASVVCSVVWVPCYMICSCCLLCYVSALLHDLLVLFALLCECLVTWFARVVCSVMWVPCYMICSCCLLCCVSLVPWLACMLCLHQYCTFLLPLGRPHQQQARLPPCQPHAAQIGLHPSPLQTHHPLPWLPSLHSSLAAAASPHAGSCGLWRSRREHGL